MDDAAFPKGQHEAARAWAQAQKKSFANHTSAISLNPKIDSKSQRRLQCSVSLGTLIEHCALKKCHILHAEWIGDVRLPLELNSSARQFLE